MFRAVRCGVLAGGIFGFLEVLLTYGTGEIPAADVVVFFAFDLALWVLVAVVSAFPRWVRRSPSPLGPWPAGAETVGLLLLGPVVVFGLRGQFGGADLASRAWTGGVRGGVTSILIAAIGLDLVRHLRARRPFSPLRFSAWALVSQSVAAAGLALRSVPALYLQTHAVAMLTLAAAYAAIVLGLARRDHRHLGLGAVSRKRYLAPGSLALSTLAAGGTAGTWDVGSPPPRTLADKPARAALPSILLVTLDTVRRDHVSAYGYSRRTTPRLDTLAARSVLFENAYATSPYTLSSHGSLFTGRLPSDHGAHPNPFSTAPAAAAIPGGRADRPLRRGLDTLASRLSERGYDTCAVVANTSGHLAPASGLAHGFQRYDHRVGRLYRYVPLTVPVLLRLAPRLHGRVGREPFRRAPVITDLALDWLDRRPSSRPFFLFLNYFDAHSPYFAPAPYDGLFAGPKPRLGINVDSISRDITSGRRQLQPEEREFLRSQYDGSIAFADDHLGRLLDGLERRGLLDDMLVIVTSDHGEFFGEHGLVVHEKALYEEVLRIPLVVKLPRQRECLRAPAHVSLKQVWDVVWKVLDEGASPGALAGLPAQKGVIAEYWIRQRLHQANPARFHSPALRAIYDGDRKLIQTSTGRDELFDLRSDPKELVNILQRPDARMAEVCQRMTARLPPLAASAAEAARRDDEAEVVDRLRSLGYVN